MIIDTGSPSLVWDCHSFFRVRLFLNLFDLFTSVYSSIGINNVNMYFAKILLMGASLSFAVVAQTTKLTFTTLPTSVTAGSPTELKWAGGDGTVSIIMLHLNRNKQSVNLIVCCHRL